MKKWEWAGFAGIVAVAAWLRFAYFGLLEFQGDEAYAAHLALQFIKTGTLPLAGLMSSVGVTNPPLFIYLMIPLFAIHASPVFVSGCIAVLGLAAVVMTWHIGRKYYGPIAGLVAGGFFAVSPWAVIYSRKIWAQDFVPVFATATMWAVHALVLGKKPKAIFWCALLPLCVVQIHFSGFALTAAVVVIVAWLRPKIDWWLAAAGIGVALVTMAPYLYLQQRTDWGDFRQVLNTVGGGQQWKRLNGVTTDPVSGYRLPSRGNTDYALDIMSAGRIEDVLGIAAAEHFDSKQVWASKPGGRTYFFGGRDLSDSMLGVQALMFWVASIWLIIVAFKATRKWMLQSDQGRAAWILVLWFAVPLAVFSETGLWTYLTYFVILYPVHFLLFGALADHLWSHRTFWTTPSERAFRQIGVIMAAIAVPVFAIGSVAFMSDYYRFVDRYGGAQGTFGTALEHKLSAARYLAEQGGVRLRQESEIQLEMSTARTQQERALLVQKLGQPQLFELNHEGRPELAQLEWPLLIAQQPPGTGSWSTNTIVILVDGNREALQPQQWQQLAQYPGTNFGPIKLYFVKR